MPNLPSGTPPLAMKYGGQMKFAMGGMQYANGGTGEMNAEVEGGGYGQDGENAVAPGGEFTQFNGPTHAQGGIQTDMAPGTRIFSDKLKAPGTNKSFAKLNTSNNTNREDKLETKGNLDPKSKTSIDLTRMAKMKNSDMLFAMQEQLKKDKVAAYAKKMGVELPPMDNQQMEPQGMPGQPQNEMPMAKYGGIHINPANKGKFTASAQRAGMGVQEFANHVLANKEDYSSTQVKRANFAHNAAGWKHEMGGVQLPYYNTDNAGNPIYEMGGGYPAMTNPYHNFKGSIPMYEDGGNMPLDPPTSNETTPINRPLKVSEVSSYGKTGYDNANMKNKDEKFEVYNNPDYLIQNQNIDTGKWNDFQNFLGTYKLPTGENFVGNKAGNTKLANEYTNLALSDYNKSLSEKYKNNPDAIKRKSVSLGDIEEVQKYYNQGNPDVLVDRILGSKTTQFRYPHFSSVSQYKAKPGEFVPVTYGGKEYVVDAETYNNKIVPVSEGKSDENVTKYFQSYDPRKHQNLNEKSAEIVNRLGTMQGGSGPFVKKGLGKLPPFIYRVGQGTQEEQWKNYQKENGLAFKYGGQMPMPKFWDGGPYIDPSETGMQEQADRNAYYDSLNKKTNNNNFVNSNGFVGNIPTNFNFEKSKAFNKEQNQRNLAFNQMTGNTNPGFSNINVPQVNNVLANNNQNSLLNSTPRLDFSKYGINSGKLNLKQPSNEDLRRETFGTSSGSETLPGADPKSKNFDWGNLAMQGANFLGQNAGNIYDLTRKNEPLETYDLATARYMDPTKAIAGENYIGRQTKAAIPGLVGGSAGAAMNLLGANKANTATRIGRLRETYDNANAQIGNQVDQYNTGIKKDQAVARAANAAALENVRSKAIHSIGSNFGQMTKSGRQDNIDQDTLKMFQWRYKNEPGFKKYIDNFSTQNNSEEGTA